MSGKKESVELSTGEKAAITRAMKGGQTLHFTEEHPEKKEAAEAYMAQVKSKQESKEPGSPKSPKGGRKKK